MYQVTLVIVATRHNVAGYCFVTPQIGRSFRVVVPPTREDEDVTLLATKPILGITGQPHGVFELESADGKMLLHYDMVRKLPRKEPPRGPGPAA